MKPSPKRSYSVIETERFGLAFAKTGSIISGTDIRCFKFESDSEKNAPFLNCIDCSLLVQLMMPQTITQEKIMYNQLKPESPTRRVWFITN